MSQIITNPALRVKLTGVCNRSCGFCNEEGDMRTIGVVVADDEFFRCVNTLTDSLGIAKVMLTGGEPTTHRDLEKIVKGILSPLSITTNGVKALSVSDWSNLRDAGLQKVIISIHDANPQSLIQLETRQRRFGWAVRALEAQRHNLVTASQAGLRVRVNTVAYGSQKQVEQVLEALSESQQRYGFEIRLLNDLANVEKSQKIIRDVCETIGAVQIREERRAGSSNATATWKTETGFAFSTKMTYRYFFDPVCSSCPIREQCHEGFYGLRVERKMSDYWVRLCIYKHTPEVLMPWEDFLKSDLAKRFRDLCRSEQQ